MVHHERKNSLLNGFSKLDYKQRHEALKREGFLDDASSESLCNNHSLDIRLAQKMIENVIGIYSIPLGVAVNFNIDGKPYVIPMVIEETSVIAAASKTAKFIQQHGHIKTSVDQWEGTGQVQFSNIRNIGVFENYIAENQQKLINILNEKLLANMVLREGGAKEIFLRKVTRPNGNIMGILHLHINTCDAMGANKINQCCEFLSRTIENDLNEKADMCILTNLSKRKMVKANIILDNIDPLEARRIEEASIFAELDPYRATTSNKGVFNAIDAILIATGNDWRAVEAGIHAYTCRSGEYKPITKWYIDRHSLIGELVAPIDVGLIGGITHIHPVAKTSLEILGVQKATELARIIAAVGLVQNLGALRALTSEGITQGHLRLHIPNLIEGIDCSDEEKKLLESELNALLKQQGYINSNDIKEIQVRIKKDNS